MSESLYDLQPEIEEWDWLIQARDPEELTYVIQSNLDSLKKLNEKQVEYA